jgi:hypothetical protein
VSVRRLILSFSLLALVLAGCGSSDDGTTTSTSAVKPGEAQAIAGDWTGRLQQEDLAPFRIAVRIDPSGAGQVAYTVINCAGVWQPRGIMGPQSRHYAFTERINRGAGGKCKGIGRVTTELESVTGKERLHYEFTGGGVTSRGVLGRTDAAGLAAVFRQAGVEPPG